MQDNNICACERERRVPAGERLFPLEMRIHQASLLHFTGNGTYTIGAFVPSETNED